MTNLTVLTQVLSHSGTDSLGSVKTSLGHLFGHKIEYIAAAIVTANIALVMVVHQISNLAKRHFQRNQFLITLTGAGLIAGCNLLIHHHMVTSLTTVAHIAITVASITLYFFLQRRLPQAPQQQVHPQLPPIHAPSQILIQPQPLSQQRPLSVIPIAPLEPTVQPLPVEQPERLANAILEKEDADVINEMAFFSEELFVNKDLDTPRIDLASPSGKRVFRPYPTRLDELHAIKGAEAYRFNEGDPIIEQALDFLRYKLRTDTGEKAAYYHLEIEKCLSCEEPDELTQGYLIELIKQAGMKAFHPYIDRENTVDRAFVFLTKMKERAIRLHLDDEAAYYEREIEKWTAYTSQNRYTDVESDPQYKDWFDCLYFRNLFKSPPKYSKVTKSYLSGIENYISSSPINKRYVGLEIDGKKVVGFYQVGVMTDHRNGWISLTDLKKMKTNASLLNGKIKWLTNEVTKNSGNNKESAQYALTQLLNIRAQPQILDAEIAKRERTVAAQFIQLLVGQIEKNPEQFKQCTTTKAFNMAHICLLNPSYKKLDEKGTGLMHDERVEIEDMKEIFAAFNNKTLICDGTGPFINGDQIHLPPIYDVDEHGSKTLISHQEPIRLQTLFFNIAVQGHKTLLRNIKDDLKVQKEINLQQIAHLNQILPGFSTTYPEIARNILTDSGFNIAIKFATCLLAQRVIFIALSIGCFSAKDRTGRVGLKIIEGVIGENSPEVNPYEGIAGNGENLADRALAENTPDMIVPKIDPRELSGVIEAGKHIVRHGKAWLKKKLSISQ